MESQRSHGFISQDIGINGKSLPKRTATEKKILEALKDLKSVRLVGDEWDYRGPQLTESFLSLTCFTARGLLRQLEKTGGKTGATSMKHLQYRQIAGMFRAAPYMLCWIALLFALAVLPIHADSKLLVPAHARRSRESAVGTHQC